MAYTEAVSDSSRSPQQEQSDHIDFRELARGLWRRRGVVIWSIVFVVAVGATFVFSLTPTYTAAAYVEINPRQAKIVNFEAVLGGLAADRATMDTEVEILRSRKLAVRAAKKLNLANVPEFNPALRSPSSLRLALGWVIDKLDSEKPAVSTLADSEGGLTKWPAKSSQSIHRLLASFTRRPIPANTDLETIREQEDTAIVDAFRDKLWVEPRGTSRVVGINFTSNDPKLAVEAANTLADLYIVAQLEAKFEAGRRANAWLTERIAKLRDEVKAKEREVELFRRKSGLIKGETPATLTGEQVTAANARYILERATQAAAEARLRQAENLLKAPSGIETADAVLNSPVIRDLRLQQTVVERRVAELSNEYGQRHPRIIAARAEKTDVANKIRIEIGKIIQGLRNDVAVAKARTQSVRNTLEGLKAEVGRANAAEVQLRALNREATASRTLLVQLLTRSKETASQTGFQQPDATIITAASLPDQPSYPKTTMMLVLLVALGAGVGVLAALVIDRIDDGYRSADQITRQLGVPTLGLVPMVGKVRSRGKDPQTYCVENPTSAYAEAMRTLHTNLLLTDVGNRPRVVMLSSAMPNEGKTSVVVSLARLLASVGQDVVVVDCDLRRPSVHKAFGAKDGPGLGDCVNGGLSIDDVIQEDTLTSARFLRAGTPPSNYSDLFDSVAFQQLLKTLSRNHDLVLLDSAPVLAVSDTLFLGRLADKTVLLVRWVATRRATAELALRKLLDARAKVAGVLLTMVDVKGHASYSYSDSGTYHGTMKRYYAG